jgi:membrane protease YdiL (CAAX protease family)
MKDGAGGASIPQRKWIAAPWHTLTILLFFAFLIYKDAGHASAAVSAGGTATHGVLLRGYFLSILFGVGMAYWCWAGVHWKGGTLRDLTGGRWASLREVGIDVAIAFPFWVIWTGTAWLMHRLLEGVQTATTPYQPPAGFVEVVVWILVSLAAGVGEEIVFRGYLQKQFQVATRSVAAAVVLQGLLFGLLHAYQGWKQVMVIAPLGILYGALAVWRGNLRANMISHAWSDLFEGWLKFL